MTRPVHRGPAVNDAAPHDGGPPTTGLVHLYTGDGKGKTTAAVGLAVRAAGRGRRVLIVQFLKGRDSGELHSLALLPNVTVTRLSRDFGFFWTMTDDEVGSVRAEHDALLAQAAAALRRGDCDVLVLDEAAAAARHGLVDEARLLELVDNRPSAVEVVLTGRDPPSALVGRADYVTEMRQVKHPYERGVGAREGIEW
ncbi:MAG: cob(I)yrinic acid a,c-diamide adenosyltransferase [Propionibacteriaceae bacterium]|jgi:cob(I)alamin adenosyltransferase|nr:cob(I)yrinic acid a,c-diamide adenosyltransferase [Propionibacteriaceae bacterium]